MSQLSHDYNTQGILVLVHYTQSCSMNTTYVILHYGAEFLFDIFSYADRALYLRERRAFNF